MIAFKPLARIFPYLLILSLFPAAASAKEEILWQSGKNQYVKLVEQEDELASGKEPPANDHPAELDRNEITNALQAMQIWNENYIRTNEVIRVFSTSQARILGDNIAKGLREAGPRQDIVFALARSERGFLSIETTEFLAGRAFYLNGRLNLIIGDYARPADRFKERMYQSHGAGDEIQYYFTHGKREESVGFDEGVIGKDGLRTHQGRDDWFLIDVQQASDTYLAEQRERQRDQQGEAQTAANEEFRREAAKMAQERREMRLEMARMRKALEAARQGSDLTVEERLKRLEDLKNQGLISEEEYAKKRRDILDDL